VISLQKKLEMTTQHSRLLKRTGAKISEEHRHEEN
jgi:hypothetical protein